ncbi:hypothetical protein OUO_0296 [Helicobacter pylori R046Wa]|nr:hypothetical protein OUO_0296 [Helicobacter pylori R046Wa]
MNFIKEKWVLLKQSLTIVLPPNETKSVKIKKMTKFLRK